MVSRYVRGRHTVDESVRIGHATEISEGTLCVYPIGFLLQRWVVRPCPSARYTVAHHPINSPPAPPARCDGRL